MYNIIYDIKNNKTVDINSKRGKHILKNYLKSLIGGSNITNSDSYEVQKLNLYENIDHKLALKNKKGDFIIQDIYKKNAEQNYILLNKDQNYKKIINTTETGEEIEIIKIIENNVDFDNLNDRDIEKIYINFNKDFFRSSTLKIKKNIGNVPSVLNLLVNNLHIDFVQRLQDAIGEAKQSLNIVPLKAELELALLSGDLKLDSEIVQKASQLIKNLEDTMETVSEVETNFDLRPEFFEFNNRIEVLKQRNKEFELEKLKMEKKNTAISYIINSLTNLTNIDEIYEPGSNTRINLPKIVKLFFYNVENLNLKGEGPNEESRHNDFFKKLETLHPDILRRFALVGHQGSLESNRVNFVDFSVFNMHYCNNNQFFNNLEFEINKNEDIDELIYTVKCFKIKLANGPQEIKTIEKPYPLLESKVTINKNEVYYKTTITQDIIKIALEAFYVNEREMIQGNKTTRLTPDEYLDRILRDQFFTFIRNPSLRILLIQEDPEVRKRILSLLDTGIFSLEEIVKLSISSNKCFFEGCEKEKVEKDDISLFGKVKTLLNIYTPSSVAFNNCNTHSHEENNLQMERMQEIEHKLSIYEKQTNNTIPRAIFSSKI